MSSPNYHAGDYLTDPARIEALYRLDILDSDSEEVFDSITRLAITLFDVPIATINLLDGERQWAKSSTDNRLAGGTIPVESTVCQYPIRDNAALVIPDLSQDPRFRNADFVTGEMALSFYAGVPLRTRDGHAVGTLCLLDRRPRETLDVKSMCLLCQLGELAVGAMELRNAQDQTHRSLLRAVEEDALTGLMSRRGILLHLQRLLGDDMETPPEIAMIEVRLGRIDRVKSGYGTAVSNQVLKDAGERIHALCESGELLACLDETRFMIARVFPFKLSVAVEPSLDTWADTRAQDVVACFDEPFVVDGESFLLIPSIGISRSPKDGVDAFALLDAADDASATAAHNGIGTQAIHWGASGNSCKHRQKLSLERRLRAAVERREFTLAYQPIVNLQNGNRIVGAEALMRWPQDDGPGIGPNLFIPLAEELGLIHEMGLWGFEAACNALRQWRIDAAQSLWISVNLSPLQLQDRWLPERLEKITSAAGVDPRQIKLEITESALIEHFDEVAGLLERLTEIGFPLALDDFGTGHSSLSRLIHLPFSILKVDRAFVSDTPAGPGAAVVASLAQLARSLGLEAVGEGIETEAHERFLRTLGYSLGQGYRYARPLSHDAFLKRVHGD